MPVVEPKIDAIKTGCSHGMKLVVSWPVSGPPSRAISVGTAPMIAIPLAMFTRPAAVIVGQSLQARCNERGHGPPMIAIPPADDCGSLHVEVWFADEARVGQKNKITRRWAKRGTPPSAPQDQRTASTYIFGAICPETGAAAGLVLPWCNTEAMGLHL